jgi:tetratricopeptide (TPR) repeat protein
VSLPNAWYRFQNTMIIRLQVSLLKVIFFSGSVLLQAQSVSLNVDQLYSKARAARASGNLNEAIGDYEALLRLDPQLAEAYNNVGSLYLDTAQYEKAVAALKKCLALRPDLASASAMLGMTYLAIGRPEEASRQLSRAAKGNPDDTHVEDLLEQSLIAIRDYKGAAQRLEQRVAHNPNDQDALYRLGRLYLTMSQTDLLRARSVDPNSALAHMLQGEIEEGAGDLVRARNEYEIAVRLGPAKPGTHEHLGNVLWLQGTWPEARTQFEEELKNDPTSCGSRWKLANTYLQENDQIPLALNELEAAIQRCPDLMQARVDHAKALILLKRESESIPDLETARRADPDEPSIHFLLAKAYRAQGRSAEAAAEMRRFGELNKPPEKGALTTLPPRESAPK